MVSPKSNRISLCKILIYFTRKNILFFFILHIYFYKIPTSIYLFYHLFYLNNNISLIFYYIKQITTHMAPPTFFFLCCEKKTDERATWRGERKKNKKIIYTWSVTVHICIVHLQSNFVYLYIFTSTVVDVFFLLKCVKLNTFYIFTNFYDH